MRFSCEKCSARFVIADEKVRGKIVAVKCNKCGHRITINGKLLDAPPAEEPSEEPTRVASLQDLNALGADAPRESSPAPAPGPAGLLDPPPPEPEAPSDAASSAGMPADGWYAVIEGQQIGPMEGAQMAAEIRDGRVDGRTYVWRDGQGDWKLAGEVEELAAVLGPPAAAPAPADPPNEPVAAESGLFEEPLPVGAPAVGEAAAAFEPAPAAADDPFADLIDDQLLGDTAPALSPAPPAASAVAPSASASPAGKSKNLDRMLFEGELDAVPTMSGKPIDLATLVANDLEQSPDQPDFGTEPPTSDPFSAVPDSQNISRPGEIGETTRAFMHKAGVTRRNPWWKYALAAVFFVVAPIGVLYLLSQMQIVSLQVMRIDEATGEAVPTPVFSGEGLHGLRDALLGRQPKQEPVKVRRPAAGSASAGDAVPARHGDESAMTDQDKAAAALYRSDELEFKGPRVVAAKADQVQLDGAGGLDGKVVGEVFAKNLKAFQTCNDNELRRNPGFKGGRITITFTVGSSGAVTRAGIDRADIDQSSLGECLREKAKRVVFPAFEGQPVEVEVPLVLTQGS